MTRKVLYIILISIFIFVGISLPCWSHKITKGPYLLVPQQTEIIIRWELDSLIIGNVYYGLDAAVSNKKKANLRGEKNGFYLYEVKLENLTPGADYFYQIKAGNIKSSISCFSTNSLNQDSFSFVAMGDSRSHPEIFERIIKIVKPLKPELIISMGDLVENGGDFEQWGKFYFDVAGELLNHIPIISTLGDHECNIDDGELFRHFLRIDQQLNEQWFSFDYGPAHFVSLDYRHPDNEKMIEWFKKDISASNAKWKFVYMHRPCYNMGGYRSTWGRKIWPELFRKFKIDIVFAGHSHLYERFYPLKLTDLPHSWPVTYITTGGAGAGLYEVMPHPYLAKAKSVNHFLYFKIQGDTLRSNVYLTDGTLLDHFIIIKQNEKYSDAYLALVKPQKSLDIFTMFAQAISIRLHKIPLLRYPADTKICLESSLNNEDIQFEIELEPESANAYRMSPISGVLKSGEAMGIPIEIYRNGDLTISEWGGITPALRLMAKYKTFLGDEKVVGAKIIYWPAK